MKRRANFSPPLGDLPYKMTRTRKANSTPVNTRARGGRVNGRGRGRGGGQSSSQSGEFSVFLNPESEICGFCVSLVEDNGVVCVKCAGSYHANQQCTGLEEAVLNCFTSGTGEGLAYICVSCRIERPTAHRGADSSNTQQESPGQLYNMVQSLATTVSTMMQQITKLTESVQTLTDRAHSSQVSLNDEDLFIKFHEFEDRKRRRDSIIVRGIIAENITPFINTFQAITEEITGNRTVPSQADIHTIAADRNLFRVTVSNRDVRVSILQNARKLKDSANFSGVFISRDLTFQQRQAAKTRREESREQGASRGGAYRSRGGRGGVPAGVGRGASFSGAWTNRNNEATVTPTFAGALRNGNSNATQNSPGNNGSQMDASTPPSSGQGGISTGTFQ